VAVPLWCRLGLHSWETVRNEDGQPILQCRRCGQLDVPTKAISVRDYAWKPDRKPDRKRDPRG
jgi:uncharacterized C2H2 Zn-finger protein